MAALWVAWCVLGVAETAWARFLIEDADRIDPEERYSVETYNDKISYRFPLGWERLWRSKDVGYRASAGSLNVSRFDYVEDLKLHVEGEAPVYFGYVQSRREDTVEQRTEREVRLGWRLPGPWRVTLLGDGGTFKEYADVGVALALAPDRGRSIEAYFWSVDHYYETKKSDAEDRRSRTAHSAGVRASWRLPGESQLWLRYEADHPLRWHRPSRGYVYEYERRWLEYRLETSLTGHWSLYAAGEHERKREAKHWTSVAGLNHDKALRRRTDFVELGGQRIDPDGEVGMGLLFVKRDARYVFHADPTLAPEAYEEEPGPAWSRRDEGGAFVTWHFPMALPHHHAQLGLHLNELRLDENGFRKSTELKTQLAWDYHLTETARIFVNTTWDMDQLAQDFPYNERAFRPWGGGNLQFIALF